MKISRILAALLAALIILSAGLGVLQLHADDIKLPNPTAEFYSNDFANVVSTDTERALVSLGEDTFQATQGGQIVFVSIDSLNGNSIEEYANELFNKWKIGTKDKGILFIVSMEDRKSRIEVGYGYEGVLTDLQSNKLLVKFSELNQQSGMDEAVKTIYADLCSIVRGEGDSVQYPDTYESNPQQRNTAESFFSDHPIMSIIMVIIILILVVLDFIFTGGRITFFILRMAAASARRGGGGGGRNSGGGGRSGGGGSSGSF